MIKPDLLDAERMQGFELQDGQSWTEPAERVARSSMRWSLIGSAVSVPVSKWIGERLNSPGCYDTDRDSSFPASGQLPRAARFDGSERHRVVIGTDPVGIRPPHLADFLKEPGSPLSLRAALGFLGRTRRAKLKFVPEFIFAVEQHISAMGGTLPPRAFEQLELRESA